jgi:DNA-binding transcriptional ArsR family regulator
MNHRGIAEIGALVGDETRSRTLVALMSGLALLAGELARLSNVSAGTISSHLSKLVKGRLLKVDAQGKHRYYRLAGPKVATLLETFGTLVRLPEVLTPNPRVPGDMCYARTCYSHLAGYLAVELNNAAIERKYWVTSKSKNKLYEVTDQGEVWLQAIGIDDSYRRGRRDFARACLDWSERRHHLAGQLGSLLLSRFLELKWIARIEGTRTIRVTQRGQEAFRDRFGLKIEGARQRC